MLNKYFSILILTLIYNPIFCLDYRGQEKIGDITKTCENYIEYYTFFDINKKKIEVRLTKTKNDTLSCLVSLDGKFYEINNSYYHIFENLFIKMRNKDKTADEELTKVKDKLISELQKNNIIDSNLIH